MSNKPKSAVFTAKQWEEHLANKRKQQLIKNKLKQQTRKSTTYIAQPDAVNQTLRIAHNLPENVNVDSKVTTLIIKDKDSKSLSNPANAYLDYKANLGYYDKNLLLLKALRRFVENGLIADLILSNPRFVEESAAPMDNTIAVTPYGSTEIQTPQQLLAGVSPKNPLTPVELALTIAPVALPLTYMIGAGGIVPITTSIAANPISWGASMGLGYLGSEGVNSGVRLLSNNKYSSWGDMLGTTDTEKFILEFTNPGGLWGGIKGWNLGRGGDKVINTFRLGREMYKTPINTNTTEPILNVGWGPKLTLLVIHKSSSPNELVTFNPQRWDVVNEGANPFGIWYLGKQGVPRTVQNGASAEKAAKAARARQLFEDRPFTHSGELTLNKPIVTVGEVPDRSALSYAAELMGADGIIYNGVYDNGFNNNLVILSFRLPLLSTIFSPLPAWEIEHLPGYLLKPLMTGSKLEKSVNKNGMININNINAILKNSTAYEKEIINKVINSQFLGLTQIDYNALRKAVLKELIPYNRVLLDKYQWHGISNLGYKAADYKGWDWGENAEVVPSTFTFESPRITVGNGKHYDSTTIGHTRTMTNPEEPGVMYILESQSDLAQHGKPDPKDILAMYDDIAHHKEAVQINRENAALWPDSEKYYNDLALFHEQALNKLLVKVDPNQFAYTDPAHYNYLMKEYLRKLLFENMRYASETGSSKMRYPTRETAALIEEYPKAKIPDNIYKEWSDGAIQHATNTLASPYTDLIYSLNSSIQRASTPEEVNRLTLQLNRAKQIEQKWLNGETTYSVSHEGILDKYSGFPKLFNKAFNGKEVRTVIDPKGNTWYEVDVPENFLDMELQYKRGGRIKLRFK